MYHYNPRTGQVSICKAKSPETCPFGVENHAQSLEEITKFADEQNKIIARMSGKKPKVVTTDDSLIAYDDLYISDSYFNAVNRAPTLNNSNLIREALEDRVLRSPYREELYIRMKTRDPFNDRMSLSDINTSLLIDQAEKRVVYNYIIKPKTNEREKYGFYKLNGYKDEFKLSDEDDTREEMDAKLKASIDKAVAKNKKLIDSGKGVIVIKSTADEFVPDKDRSSPRRKHWNSFSIAVAEYSDKPMEDKLKFDGSENDCYVDMQLKHSFGGTLYNDYRIGLRRNRTEEYDYRNIFSYMKCRHHFGQIDKWLKSNSPSKEVKFERVNSVTEEYVLTEPVEVRLNAEDKYNCKVDKIRFASFINFNREKTKEPYYVCDVQATADLYAERDGRFTADFIRKNAEKMYLDPYGDSGKIIWKEDAPNKKEIDKIPQSDVFQRKAKGIDGNERPVSRLNLEGIYGN